MMRDSRSTPSSTACASWRSRRDARWRGILRQAHRKFERILKTYFSVAPAGLSSFMMALPLWLREKLWIPMQVEEALEGCGLKAMPPLYFPEHHESHAASAFFPSPYRRAAILTLDGWRVGHQCNRRGRGEPG